MQVSKSSEACSGPLHERERAGIFSLFHYSWLYPFLDLAFQRRKEEKRQKKKKILPIARSRGHLTDTDVGDIPKAFASLDAFAKFSKHAAKTDPYKEKIKNSPKKESQDKSEPISPGARTLTLTLFKMIKKELIISGILRAVAEMAILLLPVLLFHFLSALSGSVPFPFSYSVQQQAYMLVALIFIISVIGAYGSKRSTEILRYAGVKVQQALSVAIYKKLFRLNPQSRAAISNGRVFALLTNDVRRVDLLLDHIHVAWLGAVQIVVTSILLISMLGIGAIIGLFILISSIPLQYLIVRSLGYRRSRALAATDIRVKFVDQLLTGIRAIAFNDWSQPFLSHAMMLRDKELSNQRKLHILIALLITVMNTTPLLATIAAFAATMYFSAPTLDSGVFISKSAAFASLAMFSQLRTALCTFPPFLAKAIDAKISLRRIAELLRASELKLHYNPPPSNVALELQSFWGIWCRLKPSATATNISQILPFQVLKPMCTLKDISLCIPPDTTTIIIGPAGSGKSSLLQAIMGEMSVVAGSIACQTSIFAYAPQQAWIQKGTLRDNVIFGASFNLLHYRTAITGAQLRADLRLLPLGDLTEIGGTPSPLSGGQNQRVAIARALYAVEMGISSMLVLDDPISALDAKVGKAVWDTIVARRPNTTRLIATHALHLIDEASCDWIIQMEDGRIAWQGPTYSWVQKSKENVSTLTTATNDTAIKSPFAVSSTNTIYPHALNLNDGRINELCTSSPIDEDQESIIFIEELTELGALGEGPRKSHRAEMMLNNGGIEGNISPSLHFALWRRFGLPLLSFTIISLTALHLTRITTEYALATPTRENFYFFYWILAGSFSLTTLLFAVSIAMGSWRAAKSLYRDAFSAIITSPLSFFDKRPMGTILSRLTRDTEVVDYDILDSFRDALGKFITVLSTLILVIIIMPVMVAVILPAILIISNAMIFRFYHAPILDLERLAARARSVFLQHIGDTLSGLEIIRAFTPQFALSRMAVSTKTTKNITEIEHDSQISTNPRTNGSTTEKCDATVNLGQNNTSMDFALQENMRLLDRATCPALLLASLQGWASLRFELIAASCVALTALFCVWANVEVVIAGLVLHQLLGLAKSLYTSIVSFIDLELALCSFQRLTDLEKSHDHALPSLFIPSRSNYDPKELPEWPTEGAIALRHISVKYSPDARPVLSDFSLEIAPGERLAIIGRTGSGKSTLVQALFGLIPLSEGTISIDEVDISMLPSAVLCQRLAIIPQEPVIFNGVSLRFNLDPLGHFSDAEIWEALEAASIASHLRNNLAPSISANQNILDVVVQDHSSIMSQGQTQQLCLARALLKRPRVLVLDEATSMVDTTLDTFIQQSIRRVSSREPGKGTTVITIAHRLLSILDYDRIVILQDGSIAEIGSPQALIADPTSLFTQLIRELGPSAHEHIQTAMSNLVSD